MTVQTKIGAAGFFLWGILHMAGGGSILAALTDSSGAGYAFYRHPDADFPALAGAVLGYLAYFFVASGAVVAAIAVRFNWRNDAAGLAANTIVALLVEIGLVIFFLVPGYLDFADAAPGFILFAVGAGFGGIACRGKHHATAT